MILLAAVGCGPGEAGPLADNAAWALVARGDLFPAHARAYEDCPLEDAGTFFDNGGALVLETGSCAYFALEQPALHAVAPGDAISFTLAHGDLVSPDLGTEGHVALALGDDLLYEAHVPIPTASDVQVITQVAPARAPEGTLLRLHLHNHGQNQWALQDVTSEPAGR